MKRVTRVVAVMFGVLFLALAVFSFTEAWSAYVNPSRYHFGSEAMSFHGGWIYGSQASYVRTMLLESGLFFAAGAAFVASALLYRRAYAVVAIVTAVLSIGIHLSAITPVS